MKLAVFVTDDKRYTYPSFVRSYEISHIYVVNYLTACKIFFYSLYMYFTVKAL